MRLNNISKRNISQVFLSSWESPILAGCMAMLIYSLLACVRGPVWRETQFNYFAYLADAFLHGQLNLRLVTQNTHDLVFFNNQYFLYWPPFPAILLMPLVFLLGVHISDVLVVIIFAGFNVMLVAQLLRQANECGVAPLDRNRRAFIVLFFAFGSVLFPLAIVGQVWQMAQLISFFFVGLAYLASMSLRGAKAFFFSGLFLGCAFLTRNHALFNGVWLAYFLLNSHWQEGWKKISRYSILGLIPPLLAGGLFLFYNYARFGSPIEMGLDYHRMSVIFVDDYKTYGAFNLHYLPINFYYQYINYPFPWRSDSFMGGSLFLLSPILFSVFPVFFKTPVQPSKKFLFLSIFLTAIPILLLMGTGWVQFGPRYTLDFTIPLLLLVSIGIRELRLSRISLLVAISCIQYFVGSMFIIVHS
jgi:hypothetical protein